MANGVYLGAGSSITKNLYHCEGSSGDSSGNSANGTDTNMSYGLNYGRFGQGALFNGTSSRVQLPAMASSGQATILAWLYNNGTTGGIQCVWATISTGANNGFHFQTYDDTSVVNAIYVDGGGTFTLPIATVSQLGSGWHLYGMSIKNGDSFSFLDGKELGSSSSAFTNINNATTPYLGMGFSSSRWWNGNMDEVILENTAWSRSKWRKYLTYAKGRLVL
jgi:hypothetical protein